MYNSDGFADFLGVTSFTSKYLYNHDTCRLKQVLCRTEHEYHSMLNKIEFGFSQGQIF